MSEHEKQYEAVGNLVFKRRPTALPADIRPFRKIGQILLVLLLGSSKGSAPIFKLQFFNSLFVDKNSINDFLHQYAMNEDVKPVDLRLDPFINRAISQAIGRGYIKAVGQNGHLTLRQKGKELAEKIAQDEEIFHNEKMVLDIVKKTVSPAKLNRIFRKS